MTEQAEPWSPDHLRPTRFELDWSPYAEGSCLISAGDTRVLCNASVIDDVPPWREPSGLGWVTAEYAMLPRSTHTRRSRERGGEVGGRTKEIQRLIGRSLRAVTDLRELGPRTVIVDCDVLQADGGTRTAAVTGGCVALHLACGALVEEGRLPVNPVVQMVAAVSVGLVDDALVLDLDYEADRNAQVDMNVVATASGEIVEVQGTAEGRSFTRREHDELLERALDGIATLVDLQEKILSSSS
ncbi:MAG: ribonuclease PH [Longimicrobiales bacterium]|nr:ribonuclease PH [Longimicrobiales bacterium]